MKNLLQRRLEDCTIDSKNFDRNLVKYFINRKDRSLFLMHFPPRVIAWNRLARVKRCALTARHNKGYPRRIPRSPAMKQRARGGRGGISERGTGRRKRERGGER